MISRQKEKKKSRGQERKVEGMRAEAGEKGEKEREIEKRREEEGDRKRETDGGSG